MERHSYHHRGQHQGQGRRRKHPAAAVAQAAGAVAGVSALVIAAELAYVAWKTPRLPPPDKSGHDFEPDGILVPCGNSNDIDGTNKDEDNNGRANEDDADDEFRLVLLGDSPVEGIGNDEHEAALGGQTASAFARLLHRPVRYWSYGKSGLTAGGIAEEMIPLLQRLVSTENVFPDAVVISCGVNNTLSAHSRDWYGGEVISLLDAIDDCFAHEISNRKGPMHPDELPTIILMALLDFSLMPFLPFPLSSVLGWKSRSLQRKMEEIVRDRNVYRGRQGRNSIQCKVVMAHLPPVSDVLDGSRHDLLEHLDEEEVQSLVMEDFFAADGFHPAKHGTAMLGSIIARTYMAL